MPATLAEAAAAIAAEWEASWNAHDMSRMARLITEDADWVTVAGTHLEGRAQVESVHAALHMGQLRSSVWSNRAFTVQTVAPDVALLHLRWAVQGEFESDGTLRRPRTGVFTWLLTARGGQWRIRAAHATNDANGVAPQ
jgi:uncharacterized protein (TIGR02246 family)